MASSLRSNPTVELIDTSQETRPMTDAVRVGLIGSQFILR